MRRGFTWTAGIRTELAAGGRAVAGAGMGAGMGAAGAGMGAGMGAAGAGMGAASGPGPAPGADDGAEMDSCSGARDCA